MRHLAVTNTAVDLSLQEAPFLQGYTAVIHNTTAGSLILQGAVDQAFTSPVTLATVGAGAYATAVLGYQYIRVSTAATLNLLGN